MRDSVSDRLKNFPVIGLQLASQVGVSRQWIIEMEASRK
jgi:hypothetical protein